MPHRIQALLACAGSGSTELERSQADCEEALRCTLNDLGQAI